MEKIYIKNMVCYRCNMAVKNELEQLGFHPRKVTLGQVELNQDLNHSDKEKISSRLKQIGFEIIDDKKSRLISQLKSAIIELVHSKNSELKVNLSVHLSRSLHHDYSHLSRLFSEVEGRTIEKYLIAQKIEKVKELLVYDELTLSEIAIEMNYSSVGHLSNQFKKVTGLTPSHFKKIREERRKPLDKV